MRLRILTSCKNRVKTSYKQEEGTKRLRVKESKRQRDKETKRRGLPQPLPKGKGFVAALMHRTWGSFLESKRGRVGEGKAKKNYGKAKKNYGKAKKN